MAVAAPVNTVRLDIVFVPLYMALSGMYKPRWSDIYKGATVGVVVGAFALGLNYILEGSGADFMTLRYGNGNPLAFLIEKSHVLYILVLVVAVVAVMSLIIAITIGIRKLIEKKRAKKAEVANIEQPQTEQPQEEIAQEE